MNQFQPGQHVRLELPEVGGVSGQVLDVRDDELFVSLFLNGHGTPSALEYPAVVMEYTGVRGLYRRLGTAHFDVGGVDTIRFVPEADAELLQRRSYARVEVAVPVKFRVNEIEPAVEVESINLSGSGVLVARMPLGGPELDEGMKIWLEISISDDDEPIQAWGTVLRTLDDGSKGFHFDEISESHRERLVHFLFERQRMMRQAGRDG